MGKSVELTENEARAALVFIGAYDNLMHRLRMNVNHWRAHGIDIECLKDRLRVRLEDNGGAVGS